MFELLDPQGKELFACSAVEYGGVAGGDDSPGQNTAALEVGGELLFIEHKIIEVEIGIKADYIGGGGKHRAPVAVGADMDACQTADALDGLDNLKDAVGDHFFGDADKGTGAKADDTRLIDKNYGLSRTTIFLQLAYLELCFEGEHFDEHVAQVVIIEDAFTLPVFYANAGRHRTRYLTLEGGMIVGGVLNSLKENGKTPGGMLV